MKITKELLEHLKVSSTTLNTGRADFLCFLERIEKDIWTFSIAKKIDFEKNSEIIIQVNFERQEEKSTIRAVLIDFGEDWFTVCPSKEAEDSHLQILISELNDIAKKYEKFGRRKEERVKIGKENASRFGLSKLEQTFFLPGIKLMQPCVILDASVHGICVITPETKAVQGEENFCIKIDFSGENQSIVLKAHKVYTRVNKTEEKTFLTLSCQLLEPIHFLWREKVIKMIESPDA